MVDFPITEFHVVPVGGAGEVQDSLPMRRAKETSAAAATAADPPPPGVASVPAFLHAATAEAALAAGVAARAAQAEAAASGVPALLRATTAGAVLGCPELLDGGEYSDDEESEEEGGDDYWDDYDIERMEDGAEGESEGPAAHATHLG